MPVRWIKINKFNLDELQVTSLMDTERFDVPVSTIFPEARPDEIKNIKWINSEILYSGLIHLKIKSWLFKLRDKVILIDTCVGEHKKAP